MKNRDNLNHISLLRCIAIVLVVLGHATRSTYAPNMHMYNPEYTPFIEIALKKYIYSFHMHLFFWISGYVFYFSTFEKKRHFEVKKELLNKIKRLIIPLYATSFIILLPTIIFFGHLNGSLLYQAKLLILLQNNDHLWFLKDLFIIFIFLVPLHGRLNKITLIQMAFLLFGIIILNIHNSTLPNFIDAPLKYLPFFLLGYTTRKYYKCNISAKNTFYCSILLFGLHISLLLILSKYDLIQLKYLKWYAIAFTGIYSCYFLSLSTTKFLFPKKIWNVIKFIDATSYSVYLFHVTILYIVIYVYSITDSSNVLLRIIPSFLLGIICPIILHYFFSKNKYLSYIFSIPHSGGGRLK